MTRVPVRLADGRHYEIAVGHGILADLGAHCRHLGLGDRCAVVFDARLPAEYPRAVSQGLRAAGFDPVSVPYRHGEEGKRLSAVEEITGRLLEAGLERQAWVVALGGGVVGDVAGFTAATYLRGVDVVQVPTTIVAQVDASIGGKTGVNHPLGKNLIGAFHQPRLVWADTDTLRSLPRRERSAGLAEVVKHAVIRDAEMFALLEGCLEKVLEMEVDPDGLDQLMARNARIKAEVVSADEREDGLRAILNYGHTIGHAIEAATHYHSYRHGEAVILGMIAAGHIAERLGLWSAAERRRQDDLLARLGVPSGLASVEVEAIVERTRTDKKRRGGRLRFVLARRIGQVEVVDSVDEDLVRDAVVHLQRGF